MTPWLDPVGRALDAAPQPVHFFFRDDDAGWGDDRLLTLLDVFADHQVPIDLAAIPAALSPDVVHNVRQRIAMAPDQLRIHQHGFAHANYETSGRKCEFGSERDPALQKADIETGKRRLLEMFGDHIDPIFTPPWNRCTRATGQCLVELGFRVLSRESNAPRFAIGGLQELPIHVDWFAHRRGVRIGRDAWGALLEASLGSSTVIGIMFHHAVMDREERRASGELLSLLSKHENAQCVSMFSLAGQNLREGGPSITNGIGETTVEPYAAD